MQTNLTPAQRKDIYNHLQELVDIAAEQNVSIYEGFEGEFKPAAIRKYLEHTYNFRFVQFKPAADYITDLSYPEQWIFALLVSELILHGELPE